MLQFNNEQDITDLKTEHNEYFQQINEQLQKNQLALAATALRFILESVVNTYIIKYSPEDALLNNTFAKLKILEEKKIIDSTSASTLHAIRKTANKGAHNVRDVLTKNKIQIAIAPMKKEAQLLYAKLEASLPRKGEQTYKSSNTSSSIEYRYESCPNCSKQIALLKGQTRGQIICTNCGIKYLFQSQNTYSNNVEFKRIVACPSCNQKISLPIKKKNLAVNCSSCTREFIVEPFISSNQQKTNSNSSSAKDHLMIRCPCCSNHMLHMKGQLTGQLFCDNCKTKYYFLAQHEYSDAIILKRIVTCTNCNTTLSIPISQKQGVVTCSACKHEFTVAPLTNVTHSDTATLTSSKSPKASFGVILSILNILLIIAYTAYILWKSNGGQIESVCFNWTVAGHYILLGCIHAWLHPLFSKKTILKKIFLLILAIPINTALFFISVFLSSQICTQLSLVGNLNFIIISSILYIISGLLYAISYTYGIKSLSFF